MKIITALNNQKINKELKNKTNYEILNSDIQYQEGIFEMVENFGKVDFLLLSEILPGKWNLENLIEILLSKKYAKEYIVFLEKKDIKKEEYLISKGINNIFYNNKITIEDLICLIEKKEKKLEKENEINNEIEKIKEMILNNRENKNIFKIKKYFNIFFNNKIKNKNKIQKNKIITILGAGGVGKTIFLVIFSLILKNKKILLIDFNFSNNNLKNIYFIKKYYNKTNKNKKEINLNKLIIKLNKNINLICNTENLLNNNLEINNVKNFLNEKTKEYDYILIDTSSTDYSEITKLIINISDINLFLIEPNILELKKARVLLNVYIKKWKINKEKIKLIFNKININSIDNYLLNYLFSDFKIIGKLKLNKNYNLIINSNLKIIPHKIKNEYKKIINKINKNIKGEKL